MYYQKNKDKIKEYSRNYSKNYQKINKEKKREYKRKYDEANKEKRRANKQKHYLKRKNEKEILKNDSLEARNVQDDNEGTSLVNQENNVCENKGKEPIIFKENVQLEQGIVNCVEVEHLIKQIDDDISKVADENFLDDLSFLDDH
ncbi:unnamed protein product [Meloidogyne enterolobii]|uniref:Uncharacterized protein n=1 Tax=Meloidogyne enterolobii TaxID=390850 RepID=A0ACB0XU70_MELEN